MAQRTQVVLMVDDQVLALWRADAAFAGLSLGEWVHRMIGAVMPVVRTREDVAALAGRRATAVAAVDSVDGPAVDDEDEEEEEIPVAKAPKVVAAPVAAKPPKPQGRRRTNDLAGQKFGRLTAVRIVGRDKSGYCTWLCSCECGGEKIVQSGSLSAGQTKSCGCLYRRKSLGSI